MPADFSMWCEGDYWDRIQSTWGNGATMEFLLYYEPLVGEDPTDRLQMIVTDCDGNKRGWLMNIEDAMVVIRGLSRLVDNAIRLGLSVSGDYEGRHAGNKVEKKPEEAKGV